MLTDSHIFKVNTKQYSTIKNVFNFSSYHKNPSAYLLNYLYQLKYIVCIYREIYIDQLEFLISVMVGPRISHMLVKNFTSKVHFYLLL